MWWDNSALTWRQYGAGAAIFNQISSVAGTNNVFNETGADIDTRIEGDTNANLFVCDAGLDSVFFGTATQSNSMRLGSSFTLTPTSGTVYGHYWLANHNPGGASTATFYGHSLWGQSTSGNVQTFTTIGAVQARASHQGTATATNVIALGMDALAQSTGNVTTMDAAHGKIWTTAANTIATANTFRAQAPGISGGGAITTIVGFQCDNLGTVAGTRIAFRDSSVNNHSRFVGGMSIGADAAPTTGFIADVTGDLRVSSGLNVGGTTTLANGEGIFTTSLAVGKTTAAANALDVTGKIACTSHVEIDGDLDHDGSQVGFYGVTPVARPAAYTITNDTSDRTLDADTVTVSDVADVLATVIRDLASQGLLQVA